MRKAFSTSLLLAIFVLLALHCSPSVAFALNISKNTEYWKAEKLVHNNAGGINSATGYYRKAYFCREDWSRDTSRLWVPLAANVEDDADYVLEQLDYTLGTAKGGQFIKDDDYYWYFEIYFKPYQESDVPSVAETAEQPPTEEEEEDAVVEELAGKTIEEAEEIPLERAIAEEAGELADSVTSPTPFNLVTWLVAALVGVLSFLAQTGIPA